MLRPESSTTMPGSGDPLPGSKGTTVPGLSEETLMTTHPFTTTPSYAAEKDHSMGFVADRGRTTEDRGQRIDENAASFRGEAETK